MKKRLEQLYGFIISRRRIARIMKKLGLSCRNKRRFRVLTTNSNHTYAIAPNRIQQDFYTSTPDQMYVGDITYIPTQEGWLYLAVVIDLYSRRVIGWSMDAHMGSTLVNDALFMALKKSIRVTVLFGILIVVANILPMPTKPYSRNMESCKV